MPFGGLLTLGIIGVGGNIVGSYLNSSATKDAAEKSLAASREGIEYLKGEKKQEREDFAPYAEAGKGALSKLNFGIGIGNPGDYTSNGAPKSLTPPGDPRVSPSSPAGQVIQNASNQTAQMMGPDGSIETVKASDVPHYIQLGAKVVGQSGGPPPQYGSLAAPPPSSNGSGFLTQLGRSAYQKSGMA